MCGIGAIVGTRPGVVDELARRLGLMSKLLEHRGPDGDGAWEHSTKVAGLAHRRLAIIDLSPAAAQPMTDGHGNWIAFNGEIYNYRELREELGPADFRTASDTEVILRAYRRWGVDCVTRLRGMFAFALWDEAKRALFCARDRFGIKPLYYASHGGAVYLASEAKALLPFLPAVETDAEGLRDYLTFQFCLGGKTLFKGVRELPAAHYVVLEAGAAEVVPRRYWEVVYEPDFSHTERYFEERLRALLDESVRLHLRADVPVGAYVSGGLDSSAIAGLASGLQPPGAAAGFTGKFSAHGPEFDESRYARLVAEHGGFKLHEVDIQAADFVENLRKVIWHLDYPVAGPGSFPQFMVSRLAARHRKVVLGGQGGDEIFGGYARYLIAYFEQCIRGAIDGTLQGGSFVVTYESIIPNLSTLRAYKPLLQEFWRDGLFEPMDRRYFRLVDRAPSLGPEVRWEALGPYSAWDTFSKIFNGQNVRKESYFDLMTRFDFETLLPALLQVEDRMSMAHGLESRVPLLDAPIVELAATMPANVKFRDGALKHVFRNVVRPVLPPAVLERKDKMGFPTPLSEWLAGPARDFIHDVFSTGAARHRPYIDNARVLGSLDHEPRFGRRLWGLLCLELWQQEFHDNHARIRFAER